MPERGTPAEQLLPAGVGVYSFASLFEDPYCFVTPVAKSVTCAFWSDHGPFQVHACPWTGHTAPQHACMATEQMNTLLGLN